MFTINSWFSQRRKNRVAHLFVLVAGMAMAVGTPTIAQSKTLTLEEISQKLEELEAYQKKNVSK